MCRWVLRTHRNGHLRIEWPIDDLKLWWNAYHCQFAYVRYALACRVGTKRPVTIPRDCIITTRQAKAYRTSITSGYTVRILLKENPSVARVPASPQATRCVSDLDGHQRSPQTDHTSHARAN